MADAEQRFSVKDIDEVIRAVKLDDVESLRSWIEARESLNSAALRPFLGHGGSRAVDVTDGSAKNTTLLHWAAYLGSDPVAQVLIENGANLDVKEIDGKTPLHWAAFEGHREVVVTLLASGADAMTVDKSQKTPCHLALLSKHHEVARLFPNFNELVLGVTAAHNTSAQRRRSMPSENSAGLDVGGPGRCHQQPQQPPPAPPTVVQNGHAAEESTIQPAPQPQPLPLRKRPSFSGLESSPNRRESSNEVSPHRKEANAARNKEDPVPSVPVSLAHEEPPVACEVASPSSIAETQASPSQPQPLPESLRVVGYRAAQPPIVGHGTETPMSRRRAEKEGSLDAFSAPPLPRLTAAMSPYYLEPTPKPPRLDHQAQGAAANVTASSASFDLAGDSHVDDDTQQLDTWAADLRKREEEAELLLREKRKRVEREEKEARRRQRREEFRAINQQMLDDFMRILSRADAGAFRSVDPVGSRHGATDALPPRPQPEAVEANAPPSTNQVRRSSERRPHLGVEGRRSGTRETASLSRPSVSQTRQSRASSTNRERAQTTRSGSSSAAPIAPRVADIPINVNVPRSRTRSASSSVSRPVWRPPTSVRVEDLGASSSCRVRELSNPRSGLAVKPTQTPPAAAAAEVGVEGRIARINYKWRQLYGGQTPPYHTGEAQ